MHPLHESVSCKFCNPQAEQKYVYRKVFFACVCVYVCICTEILMMLKYDILKTILHKKQSNSREHQNNLRVYLEQRLFFRKQMLIHMLLICSQQFGLTFWKVRMIIFLKNLTLIYIYQSQFHEKIELHIHCVFKISQCFSLDSKFQIIVK